MTPRTGIVLGAAVVLARLGVAALHGGPIDVRRWLARTPPMLPMFVGLAIPLALYPKRPLGSVAIRRLRMVADALVVVAIIAGAGWFETGTTRGWGANMAATHRARHIRRQARQPS